MGQQYLQPLIRTGLLSTMACIPPNLKATIARHLGERGRLERLLGSLPGRTVAD